MDLSADPEFDKLNLKRVKTVLLDLLSTLRKQKEQHEIKNFEKWVSSGEYLKDLEKFEADLAIENKINAIVEDLRDILPANDVLPSEKIVKPNVGPNSDCEDSITRHVDEFLYDDDELDKLIEEEKLDDFDKSYCVDCGSRNIKDIISISHSLSRKKMQYVFKCLLPEDCSKFQILDVGSRIGAVLYGANFYSNADKIFGVEISEDLCKIQNKIIESHNLNTRIKIINGDIMDQAGILKTSDVVILNNVFEFFMPVDKQIRIWKFLKSHIKKGCFVVTLPSLEESFHNLEIYDEICVPKWFTKKSAHRPENFSLFTNDEMLSFHDIYFYVID